MSILSRIRERLVSRDGEQTRAYLDATPLAEEKLANSDSVEKKKRQDKSASSTLELEYAKALDTLQAERDALTQRVLRLETMLADPEKGQNAILYFRLRAIWDMCHDDLMALSQQFQEKYADIVEETIGDTTVATTNAAYEAFVARQRVVQARLRSLQDEQKRINYELHVREKPFKPGEKLALTEESAKVEKQLDEAARELKDLENNAPKAPDVQQLPSPPVRHRGPNLQTRRAINIALIALAQYFYLFYREDQIAAMALRASRKPVEDTNFGLASECLEIGYKVRELATLSRNERNRHEAVRQRVEYLKNRLRYPSDSDAIPDQHSVNTIPVRVDSREGLLGNHDDLIPINVLALNYWDINKTLLR
ncbi:MAG: hypothetical protein WCB49_00360 [Gammaproteobacteria bacterium]